MTNPGRAECDRAALRKEMERTQRTFHDLLNDATAADLRRPSEGTRWSNEQLLFHMLFGYLIVRALLGLSRALGRMPGPASTSFAWLLNTARRPFHLINYAGSVIGARIIPSPRMGRAFDRVITALQRSLDREPDANLRRGMRYPTSWDPFFASYMTMCDLYRYPTQHFDFHQEQLTLHGPDRPADIDAVHD